MKKIAVIAIAVLFSLVAFRYASAQTFNYAFGGHLTTFSLDVTYQQKLPATSTLHDGKKFITVASGLNKVVSGKREYDPYIRFWWDTNGEVYKILISWWNPTNPSERIFTISCSGGNEYVPALGTSQEEDGFITTDPQYPENKPPATFIGSVEAVATCYFCPDGFAFTSPTSGVPTGVCNSGLSYNQGYMTIKGTFVGVPSAPAHSEGGADSITITGMVAGSGFNYVGEQWVAQDCNTNGGTTSCTALFDGTIGAKLTPCPTADPQCLNQ